MKTLLRRLVARLLEERVRTLVTAKHLKVVAVGGSVGKTSTKLAIAQVLEEKYPGAVLAHPGNFNMEISLPLAVFELPLPSSLVNPLAWWKVWTQMGRIIRSNTYPYKILVLELGIDHPGEMERFMRYLSPDIGVVTAITPEHLEYLHDMDTVTKEEFLLAQKSKQAVVNADDKQTQRMVGTLVTKPVTFGEQGTLHIEKPRLSPSGWCGTLTLSSGATVEVQTQLVARHGLNALLAAAAVGELLSLSRDQIRAGVESFHPVAGRMQVLAGIKETMILDDTYNSSPDAAIAAIETLEQLSGRHIAIMGDMNEQGDYSERAHKDVGAMCGRVDELITIGAMGQKWLAPAAQKAGLSKAHIHTFISPYDAGQFVTTILQPKDIVLAKGSQNRVFAEEAVKSLLANPEDAAKLVRQSPDWITQKKKQFSKG